MSDITGRSKSQNKSAASSVNKNRKRNINPGKIILRSLILVLIMALIFIFIAGSAMAGLASGGVYGIIKTTPMLDPKLFKSMGFNSYVYDAEGNVIAELKKEENRVWINYDEIPKMLINAFVAVEDKRFFEHEGVDFKRISSAAFTYFKKLLGADVDVHGGSTITQQLIKNLTKKNQVTITRKLQEQWQAMQLEKVLTKEEIITYYLNNVPMGGTFYGVETASKGYFGKDVRTLSLAECASLAGITNLPSKYMPIDEERQEANLSRMKMILGLMLEQGMITQSEYDEAVNEEIHFNYNPQAGKVMQTSNQSYFVDEAIKNVKEELMKTYGYTEMAALDIIYNSGLHIYTTMDPKVQDALTETFTDPEYFSFKNKYADEPPQAAMVVVDYNGNVRGIYGGRGEKEGSVFNRATQARRSPGSSIKPLLVYGPGIETRKITAATVVDDVKQYLLTNKPNEEWPKNVEKKNYGLTGVREGLYRSRNVVATLLLKNYVGLDTALSYLKKLGMDRTNEKYLSIAMGGFNEGMTPLEMAGAYTVFANKGVYTKPTFFTEVKDNEGNVILSNKPEREQVFSEQTVYIMDSMMEDVVKRGTASGYGTIKYKNADGKTITIQSAGKTGTSDKTLDKWFAGFTPYYVGVTWYGYDKNVTIMSDESNVALKIWNAVMNKIHEGLEPKTFFDTTPPNIVKRTICIDSGKIATDLCKNDPRGSRVREEYFIEGTEPSYSDTCNVHISAKVCTASKDAYGRYLLATEYCPASTVKDIVAIKRPVEYTPKFPNDGYPEDFVYELPEGEYCTVHHAGTLIPPVNFENPNPQTGNPGTSSGPVATQSPYGGILNNPLNEDIGDPAEQQDWDSIDWGNDPSRWN